MGNQTAQAIEAKTDLLLAWYAQDPSQPISAISQKMVALGIYDEPSSIYRLIKKNPSIQVKLKELKSLADEYKEKLHFKSLVMTDAKLNDIIRNKPISKWRASEERKWINDARIKESEVKVSGSLTIEDKLSQLRNVTPDDIIEVDSGEVRQIEDK